MHRDLPRLAKEELFERLAAAGNGLAVVTPNRRLAQALAGDFDRRQSARGRLAWETADILPFDAFVRRLWEDALYAQTLALLLSPNQERALWQDAIVASRPPPEGFSVPAAAAQCAEAWKLSHAWRIPIGARTPLSEDARVFAGWAGRYERWTGERGQVDAARLPDALAALETLRLPRVLVTYGFDLVTPQMRAALEAFAARGCEVLEGGASTQAARLVRVELNDAREEIAAVARWARARLEADPAARIGIVVPDLARSRGAVERAITSILRPSTMLGADTAALPFTLSLGRALGDYPLVHDALALIGLATETLPFLDASRLVRSAFVAGAVAEAASRAALDAWLRERVPMRIGVDALLRLCEAPKAPARAPLLVARLKKLAEFRKANAPGVKTAGEWARVFSSALTAAGFPGERTPDSVEHQTLAKWHELLAELASLERVTARMSAGEARRRLARMAADTIFQPQALDVPIHVLGVLESAGPEFDHLWVTGLSDEAWPLAARANPFVPVALQRAAGVPQADPAASLALDRRITEGWKTSAREVVFSHFRMQGESELHASPLIAGIPVSGIAALEIPVYGTARDAIRACAAIEIVDDARGPAAPPAIASGGTRLFRDQAACPFRAFARYRLGSKPLEAPQHGLNARDRGSLVHCMLAAVWKRLGTQARLAATPAAELESLIAASADEAIGSVRRYRADALCGRFAELERERLMALARDWLAMEARRAPFAVVAMEEKRPMTFGGVSVNVKLDRMDRLEAGGDAVLDYKTGDCKTGDWMGARPEEPQLPMYALSVPEVVAVAFAQVKAGVMCFRGIGKAADLIPGVNLVAKDRSRAAKQYADWDALLAGWKKELEALGRGFVAGDARVDPKKGAATCGMCDQQMVCRIAEKAPFGEVGGGERDE